MGRFLGLIGALIGWLCIATLLAQVVLLSLLWTTGRIDRGRLLRALAVLQGNDAPLAAAANTTHAHNVAQSAPLSPDDVQLLRSVKLRQLELREQSLEGNLKQLRYEQEKLLADRQRYDELYLAFKEQLKQDRASILAQGNENARALLEAIRPRQAKEIVMQMLEKDEMEAVVTLYSSMSTARQAKIAAEFKTPEEVAKFDEILRHIRQGVPQAKVVDGALQQLEQKPEAPAQLP